MSWISSGLSLFLKKLSMLGIIGFNPEAVGKGSSTAVLVKSGRIVYNANEITITPMMISIIIVFLFIDFRPE
jgi:hypothetical protein